jgi:hypothetical protein
MISHTLWLAWVVSGTFLAAVWLAWFGVMEGIAIHEGGRTTLSEVVWDHFGVPAVFWFGVGALLTGTWTWLWLHFMSKGRWGI